MDLINKKLENIITYLGEPFKNNIEGDKLVCYLTFPVEKCIDVKKNFDTFVSFLKHHHYKPKIVSIAKIINNFLATHPNKNIWLENENFETKLDFYDFFKDLSSILKNNKVIENHIIKVLEEMKINDQNILVLNDLEALHPFTRFGPIEQELYSVFNQPILIFYPGTISGSALKFLDIYPEDGNYRSKHF